MPAALPLGIRQQIVEEKLQGKTLRLITQEKKLSYSTVCNIWRLHKKGGSLIAKYGHCGPKEPKYTGLLHRASIWLKRLHPQWGAAFISLKLQERYPTLPLATARTMQRWFKKAGLGKVRSKIPKGDVGWAKQVHETWQIDAKEQFKLQDGQPSCYLTMVDEKSGSLLAAKVFPPVLYQSSRQAKDPGIPT